MSGGLSALALVIVAASSSAAFAGPDDDSLYTRIMRAVGLKNPLTMEYGENYSERSPLVVPPTRDLPPPQAAVAPAVPNWPKDPDVAQRALARAKEKPQPHVDWVVENSRPLRPDELNVPGGAASGGSTGSVVSPSEPGQPNPAASGSKFSSLFSNPFKKEDYTTFTGEPARASLTDPPPGYLTPSPDQPYGIGSDKTPAKAATAIDRANLPR